jgi:hypothetical protein
VWLVTDGGVAKWMDGAWALRLTDYEGSLAGIDDGGRIWVVGEDTSEIAAWDGTSWDAYSAAAGWLPVADDWFRSVGWGSTDGSGWFWVTTSEGVRAFNGERWAAFTPQEMGMEARPDGDLAPEFGLTITGDGGVWVRECDWGGPGPFGGQGARWFDGERWWGADSPVASGCATAIAQDGYGNVWVGLEGTLWRYDPTARAWTSFSPPDPPVADMRFGFVHAIAFGPAGDPWPAMVLCGGASCYGQIALYHLRDGGWDLVGEPLDFGGGLPAHRVVGDGAESWLFWSTGLYRLGADGLEQVPDLDVRSHVVDAGGRVWFVAPRGGQETLWTLEAAQ